MKKFGYLLISGLLIAFSFPTVLFGWPLPNLGFFAWFGLVPLIYVIRDTSPREAFRDGFFVASLFFLISYYWIFNALHTFGHISPLPSLLTLLLLSLFMALYIGAACFFARLFVLKSKGELLVWLPVFWTLLEWTRNYTPFGGFPWSNLAMSQTSYLPLIQFADITGTYGIIFLLVWFNVWLTEAILKWEGREVSNFKSKTIVTALLLFLVVGYGVFQITKENKIAANAPLLKIGLIQPNIPQEEKWNPTTALKQKLVFTEAVQNMERNVDLIVWPEASFTEPVPLFDKWISPEKIGLHGGTQKRPYTLLGLNFYRPQGESERYLNSAAIVDATGMILDRYSKVHLVPFGETIPLKKIFSFLTPLTEIGDFDAGTEVKPLGIENVGVGPLICYEDIFPEISRALVKKGASLLINMTNDAWYGVSSAPYQHLALATLRSVETKRAMVRATNTGVTAVIGPTGRVIVKSPIFERGVLIHQVPLLMGETPYTWLGDWFIAACFILILWQGIKFYVQRN